MSSRVALWWGRAGRSGGLWWGRAGHSGGLHDPPPRQFVLAALVLSLLLPKTSQYVKWIVAAGLAQVSEFALVLGSRARRARVISRESGGCDGAS